MEKNETCSIIQSGKCAIILAAKTRSERFWQRQRNSLHWSRGETRVPSDGPEHGTHIYQAAAQSESSVLHTSRADDKLSF